MLIRVAVITPEDFAPRITAHAEHFDQIKFQAYLYRNPMECGALVEQIQGCDVLLFAGPLPYYFANQRKSGKRLPSVYIPSDEYTLTLNLGHILLNRSEGLRALSVDTPKRSYLEQAVAEWELDSSQWCVTDYSQIIDGAGTVFDPEQIFHFHRENYQSGRCNLVLTSVDYVYEQLKLLGIPCINMIVPEKSIRETVARAAHIGQLMISENAQIAVGLAAINQLDGDGEGAKPDAGIMLQQLLLELGKETDASIQQLGLDQFILYGTRGSIEQMTDHFTRMPVMGSMEHLFGVTISMGFGFGMTAKEAEAHARIGLFHARKQKESSAFLVTHEKEVIGPLGAANKAYHLKSEDRELLHIAELTGLSIATVSKLSSFIKLRRENRFTATDLSEYLQLSRRSAERILKKMIEQHFVESVGEEQPYKQGRPRAVYRSNF
ncbi:transcriptional regulator [Brevibacillus choshinensis]|uniref:Transcriptional regulator n=1 Tax=Brevibacillus choshinensis TaxID=54911 RepID=A0ABX7FKG3_BRECH|nr:transcriptional regulator [Brevibacillus choshinensis]QRG66724.1 transcriptional regulator [Brevibacillus choshinensis]